MATVLHHRLPVGRDAGQPALPIDDEGVPRSANLTPPSRTFIFENIAAGRQRKEPVRPCKELLERTADAAPASRPVEVQDLAIFRQQIKRNHARLIGRRADHTCRVAEKAGHQGPKQGDSSG